MFIKYLCSCYMNVRYLAYKCMHTSTFDRFMLYMSHPTRSMPFHKDMHGRLGMYVKTHWVKHFGNWESDTEEHTRKMSSQQDQLYLRWELQKPETEFIGVHTCTIYVQYNWGNWNIHSSRSYRAVKPEKKQDETKHPNTKTKDRTPARISLQSRVDCGFSTCPKRRFIWKQELF